MARTLESRSSLAMLKETEANRLQGAAGMAEVCSVRD